ncbi:MAG: DEAD/DEAH box helicase family protein [Rhodoblastus sp.]|nr:DEAD/DEAH box helicase family protein [Rhodoblastus sp.]
MQLEIATDVTCSFVPPKTKKTLRLGGFVEKLDAFRQLQGLARAPEGLTPREHIIHAWTQLATRLPHHDWLTHAHQRLCADRIISHITNPANRPNAISVIPTAGGKSRIFLELLNATHLPGIAMPTTIVLTSASDLLKQTRDDLARQYPEIPVGQMNSKHGHKIRPVTFMTYELFTKLSDEGRLSPEDVDLLLLDEAHRALSDLRRGVLERYFDKTIIAAFSATPAYDEKKSLHELLGYENHVHSSTTRELRDAGVITEVINPILRIDLGYDLPSDPLTRKFIRYKAFAQAAMAFVATHVDERLQVATANRPAIAFGASRIAANILADEYNRVLGGDREAMLVVTGERDAHDLHDAKNRILKGTARGIANCRMAVEGFDLPVIKLVINSPTYSMLKSIQQSGRAQRRQNDKPIDHPDQIAFVIDACFIEDGEIVGKPRFYFEAANEMEMARVVDVEMDPLDDGQKIGGRTISERLKDDLSSLSLEDLVGNINFKVSTEVSDTVRLLRSRDGESYLIATDDWLCFKEVAAKLGVADDNKALALVWRKIAKAARLKLKAVVNGAPIDTAMMVSPYSKSRTPEVYLHHTSLERLKAAIDAYVFESTQGWTPLSHIADQLGLSRKDKALRRFLRQMTSGVETSGAAPASEIHWQVRRLKRGTQTKWYFETATGSSFAAHIHERLAAPRIAGQLSETEVAQALGLKSQTLAGAWKRLTNARLRGSATKVLGHHLDFQVAIENGAISGFLAEQSLASLRKALRLDAPQASASEEWLDRTAAAEAIAALGVPTDGVAPAWRSFTRALKTGRESRLGGRPVRVAWTLQGLRPRVALAQATFPSFASALAFPARRADH